MQNDAGGYRRVTSFAALRGIEESSKVIANNEDHAPNAAMEFPPDQESQGGHSSPAPA
jgi:hypothetical protein